MEDAEEIATGVTARQLAEAVLANAEDPALTRRAETLLGRKASNVADLPILGEPREGLRALFVLLPPSDAALVSEAAAAFTTATGHPVTGRPAADGVVLSRPRTTAVPAEP